MKRSEQMFWILLLGILLVGCGGSDSEENASEGTDGVAASSGQMKEMLILPRVGVGELRFGMTVEEIKELLGEPFVLPEIDGFTLSDDNYLYPELGIKVLVEDNEIHIIYCISHLLFSPELDKLVPVKACKFKTTEGIGIGSTKAEIIAAYGEPDRVAGGNHLAYKELEMLFALDFGVEVTEIMMWEGK